MMMMMMMMITFYSFYEVYLIEYIGRNMKFIIIILLFHNWKETRCDLIHSNYNILLA